jgi:hypothetical protein
VANGCRRQRAKPEVVFGMISNMLGLAAVRVEVDGLGHALVWGPVALRRKRYRCDHIRFLSLPGRRPGRHALRSGASSGNANPSLFR